MKTTIDRAGRLVIPKKICQEAGLEPGTLVDVRWHDGRIEIEPAHVPVTVVRKGRFVVAVPQADGPLLTMQDVEETRAAIMREHERGL